MEKVSKKEIRVVFNLNNEKDKELYNTLAENTQPGKIIKNILSKYLHNSDAVSNSQSNNEFNIELLKVLSKLNDKIDNLTIVQSDVSKEKEESSITEISLTAEVSSADIDDIDF